MKNYFLYLCLTVLVCNVILPVNLSADELPVELKNKADLTLQGFDDTIMRINSGICRITGTTVRPGNEIVNDDILIAFDYSNHYYRFDNGKLIRTLLTPDFYYELWGVNEPAASVRRSSVSDIKVSNGRCDFIDIQSLYCFVPVGTHGPNGYQKSVLHRQIKQLKKLDYKDNVNGLTSVTFEFPNPYNYDPPLTATYFINKTNGYTVQHIEYNCGYIMDISWKNINQTWVPIAYVLKTKSNFNVEWKIEWEQVNEKVDAKFFDLDEMVADRTEDVPMLSEELDSPIIIGKIGKDSKPLVEQPQRLQYIRLFLIIAGLVLLFIGISKKGYDRWKQKKKQ
jgi:hypothetical protein